MTYKASEISCGRITLFITSVRVVVKAFVALAALLIVWDCPSDDGYVFFRVWAKETVDEPWHQIATQFYPVADIEVDTPTKFLTVSAVYPDGQEIFAHE